ncbi:hypothetical protein CYY_007838 [Polysphondylium violaceum]|uniref:RCR-type E3 ubiquitin transferase n=1 Tax=Polysphondylium violaceum TaxID=133409 RepID=A0A8J4PPP8_9MYCE|nr:hypothetical protein CYY_007838 [Polysphondylium violaceum]
MELKSQLMMNNNNNNNNNKKNTSFGQFLNEAFRVLTSSSIIKVAEQEREEQDDDDDDDDSVHNNGTNNSNQSSTYSSDYSSGEEEMKTIDPNVMGDAFNSLIKNNSNILSIISQSPSSNPNSPNLFSSSSSSTTTATKSKPLDIKFNLNNNNNNNNNNNSIHSNSNSFNSFNSFGGKYPDEGFTPRSFYESPTDPFIDFEFKRLKSNVNLNVNNNNNNNNNKSTTTTTTTTTTSSTSNLKSNVNINNKEIELDDEEERNQKLIQQLMSEQENSDQDKIEMECTDCLKQYPIEEIVFLDCSDIYCKKCLHNFIMAKSNEKKVSKIKCKSCKKPISNYDIKQVLTEQEFSIYQGASLDQVINKNKENFVKCPSCSIFMEKIIPPQTMSFGSPWSTDGNGVRIECDANGKPLSRESIEHKKKYRFRCLECSTIFCTECLVHPYHLGFTCADYQIFNSTKHCRYCKTPLLYSGNGNGCANEECKRLKAKSCKKKLECGHPCMGIRNELECLPCIHPDCKQSNTNQKMNDYCNICWTDDLESAPSIQLDCGHIFHYHCCKNIISKRWSSSRISFGFLKCSLCSQNMSHPSLEKYIKPINDLYDIVQSKGLQRLSHFGPEKGVDLNDTKSKWFNNKESYVMERFSYFMCFKCKNPYFGGEKACGENTVDFKVEDLICGGCSSNGNETCKIHGKEYIEYKCKYCCNISIFFCWGKTHFCDDCHKKVNEVARTPKSALPRCKCKVKHEEGEEYCFGCSLCRILSQ